jgi:hypothetical protein
MGWLVAVDSTFPFTINFAEGVPYSIFPVQETAKPRNDKSNAKIALYVLNIFCG